MTTALELIPALVDAPPIYWDRSYSQNMREIRGYPNWWRIRDDIAYIDGPPNEGEQYTKDLYIWSVEIKKDENTGENSDTLELYDLANTLIESSEVVNGQTIYKYKYRSLPPVLTYTHTDVIDSVSLEFDQLGRRMIAFESMGDIFLIWYDSQAGQTVVTDFGIGHTPYIVTDTYIRTAGSAASERLLFYVDGTTNQIVYRRQDDRFQVKYNIPSAPSDVVEILKVSKNLYGGLTVLYCYDDGTGNLATGSFTARSTADGVNIGTDGFQKSKPVFEITSGTVLAFSLKDSLESVNSKDLVSFESQSSQIVSFFLQTKELDLIPDPETASFETTSGNIVDFNIRDVQRSLEVTNETASTSTISGAIVDFENKVTLISVSSYTGESAQFTTTTGSVVNFSLG